MQSEISCIKNTVYDCIFVRAAIVSYKITPISMRSFLLYSFFCLMSPFLYSNKSSCVLCGAYYSATRFQALGAYSCFLVYKRCGGTENNVIYRCWCKI
jgi:hypothetical protein